MSLALWLTSRFNWSHIFLFLLRLAVLLSLNSCKRSPCQFIVCLCCINKSCKKLFYGFRHGCHQKIFQGGGHPFKGGGGQPLNRTPFIRLKLIHIKESSNSRGGKRTPLHPPRDTHGFRYVFFFGGGGGGSENLKGTVSGLWIGLYNKLLYWFEDTWWGCNWQWCLKMYSLVGHSGSRADIAKKPTSANKSGKVFFQLTIAL